MKSNDEKSYLSSLKNVEEFLTFWQDELIEETYEMFDAIFLLSKKLPYHRVYGM